MKHWILRMQSLNNPFTYIEVDRTFQIDIRANTDIGRRGAAVFRAESIEAGDKILGLVSSPVNEIRYEFEVVEIDGTILSLNKVLESKYGLGLNELENIDRAVYNDLIQIDPNEVGILIEVNEEFFRSVEGLMVQQFVTEPATERTDDQANDDTVRETEARLERPERNPRTDNMPHNRIIFGSPGTGKSYQLEKDRKKYFGTGYERVTFHPNYPYGQFVGTYKPRPTDDGITYELVPGPLLRLLAKALNREERNYLLVIEEINRANTAAVFGDIFQLLDRNENGESEYSIMVSEEIKDYLFEKANITLQNNELFLPSNLYIWSTMNTADQGVYPIDSAFKRRFDFEYIGIDESEEEISGIQVNIPGIGTIERNEFRKKLNDFLLEEVRNMKEDKLIGPFFIKKEVIAAGGDTFKDAFKNKLLMYLSEDVLKTNKSVLFNSVAFSKIVQQFNRGENVFSDTFTQVLQGDVSE